MPSIETLIKFVIYLLILGVVLWALWWAIGLLPLPGIVKSVAVVIIALIALLYLVRGLKIV